MRNKFQPGNKFNPQNTPEDFWANVNCGKENECWNWTGMVVHGCGQFRMNWKRYKSNRLAYELTHGLIPKGLRVCHRRDNPLCCNPNHLFLGTPQDNSSDMVNKNRQTKGTDVNTNKLTPEQVEEIRRLYATGRYSQRDLGRKYGVYHSTVGRIIRRKTWKWFV